MPYKRTCIWKGVLAGALGGLAGTLAMTAFQQAMSKMQRSNGKSGEPSSEPATVKAANALSLKVRGRTFSDEHKNQAGQAVHYGFGIVNGALFGALAERIPKTESGYGALFGTSLWAVADEAAVPALGLSGPPWESPVSSHANALGAHLIYGVTTFAVTRAIRSAL